MVQSSVTKLTPTARAGLVDTLFQSFRSTGINEETVSIPYGVALIAGTDGDKTKLPAAAGAKFKGISAFSHAAEQATNAAVIGAGQEFNLLRFGIVNVIVEDAVVAGGIPHARVTSDGSANTQLGKIRSNIDAGRAVPIPGAEFITGAAAGGLAQMYVDLMGAENSTAIVVGDAHAQLTDDATVLKFVVPTDKTFILDGAKYANVTGLVAHADNFFNMKIQKGPAASLTVMANWSTETGQQGTIAAAAVVDLVNGTLAARTCPAGTIISVMYDETGTATLPAGLLSLFGRLI